MNIVEQEILIPTFLRKDGAFLFHLAFLPSRRNQQAAAALSQRLNRGSSLRSCYELVTGDAGRSFAHTKTFSEGAKPLTGTRSLPHATVMHFWATPEQAENIVRLFNSAGSEVASPRSVRTGGTFIYPSLPRFLHPGEVKPQDIVAWIGVDRDEPLVEYQKVFHAAVMAGGGIPVTGLGDKWNPHWTLMVLPHESIDMSNPIAVDKEHLLTSSVREGEMVLGLSGPNGQFRGVLASVREFNAGFMPVLAA